jgi:hypothetical protein
MAVVLPNGVFFRGGVERDLRRELVGRDLVEAVIELPKDLFYGAGIPACYLVINRSKPAERTRRILFVDASQLCERVEAKNVLRDGDVTRIANAFSAFEDQDGFAAVVDRDEIERLDYTLGVRRYVKSSLREGGSGVDVDTALAAYRVARSSRLELEARLERLIATLADEDELTPVALEDIAEMDVEKVTITKTGVYRIAGVKIAGEGLFAREDLLGEDTSYPKLHRLRAGQLVYRKLTAWEGPITVVTPEFEGYFVSPEFPTFTLDRARVDPEFMALLCRDRAFHLDMRSLATGTAERRNRLKPEDLLQIEIELPSLQRQRTVAALARLGVALRQEATTAEAVAIAARSHDSEPPRDAPGTV